MGPSPNVEFYRRRTRVADAIGPWSKRRGLKSAATLLTEIVRRSHPSEPWTWVRITSMDAWAESWGMSERTLHRHLTQLHELGYLTSAVREVKSIKKPGMYPAYSIPEHIIGDILEHAETANLADSDCQSGRFDVLPIAVSNARDSAGLTMFDGLQVQTDSKKETLASRGSRRLRRRVPSGASSSRDVEEVVVVDLPAVSIGKGGKPPPVDDTPKRAQTPASRLEEHFSAEWHRARTAHPTQAHLPLKPYGVGNKTRFYGWVNRHLIPAVGGEDAARELITLWCGQIISGLIPVPDTSRYEVYWLFSRDLDRLRTEQARAMVRSVSDEEQFLAEQRAYQERRAAEWAANEERLAAERHLRVVGDD